MARIVAFQGETGAFSEAAAAQLVNEELTLLPCRTFDDAVRTVVNGHADFAVLPTHNSIAGDVSAASAAMEPFAALERVRELVMPIQQSLLGIEGASVDHITEVLSHPVALAQCTRFLASHPGIRAVEASDTAGAARMVGIRRDMNVAAIAAPWAAGRYGLRILIENVADEPDNRTTFVLIRRRSGAPLAPEESTHHAGLT